MNGKKLGFAAAEYFFVALVCLICLFPILWIVMISVKPVTESMMGISAIIPKRLTFENYKHVLELIPNLPVNFFNNVFVSLVGTVTTLFFCSLAGFAFAKYEFPGRNFLYLFLLATMMIPQETGVIPLFIIFRNMGLINSLWGLIIPRLATAVGIFYMTEYMRDVPYEIIEAARMDGCSEFRIYWRIVCPIIKPGLASWAMLTMIARWNDFFWPLILLRNSKKYTLMVAISLLPSSDGLSTPWPTIMAGVSIAVFPVLIAFVVLQRLQVVNVAAGAVKG